ncbi:MAG: hypothetical protein E6J74_22985 [Deltaproteobacteria bacterium]|nr:MAG: hypothetical protein E6J74_22985 [Deltaproteobacteria bacterium]
MKKRPAKERKSKHVGNPPKDPQQRESPVDCELLFQGISNPKKRRFLAGFARCGSVTNAAKRAKIHWSSHYKWLKEADNAAYTEAFNRARDIAGDIAEGEIYRRAFLGFNHPVIYEGEINDLQRLLRHARHVLAKRLKARALPREREPVRQCGASGR